MDLPDEDTIRILVTTDNHIGYNENDPITGDDSWRTFHEIMMMTKEYNVDMVVQAGDLFHVNKPSKKSLYQVIKTLRSTCMGSKPCELEMLSDPAVVFHYNEFTNVNYEDPNFNIAVPVFGIAGNHDDATGDSLLCPMDVLQVTGLINHFGKVLETDKITLAPILFQKGITKLALYGLASVRDERLFRTFKDNNVTFEVPATNEGKWFNMMCVHQNHTGHTNTAFLPEQFLPNFLDLVIWGHEHECIPHLVHNPTKQFDVLQPGSSVATSLCEAEAQPKNVFILEIKADEKPKLIPIPLKTCRTFVIKTIVLQDVSYLKPHDKESITKYLISQVEEMIEEANSESMAKLGIEFDKNDTEQISKLPLPLVRLRVDYTGPNDGQSIIDYQVENPRRFSNRFVGKVANNNNIVHFYKRKQPSMKKQLNKEIAQDEQLLNAINEADGELEVQTLVNDLLSKMSLSLLPENGMNEAIKNFVDKDEKAALKDFIDHEISNEIKILVNSKEISKENDPAELKELIRQVKRANSTKDSQDNASSSKLHSKTIAPTGNEMLHSDSSVSDFDISDHEQSRKNNNKLTATKKTRQRKSVTPPPVDSIVISDEDDVVINDMTIDHSGERVSLNFERKEDEIPSTQQIKSAKPIAKKRATKVQKIKESKTPKTDILKDLLARKRR